MSRRNFTVVGVFKTLSIPFAGEGTATAAGSFKWSPQSRIYLLLRCPLTEQSEH